MKGCAVLDRFFEKALLDPVIDAKHIALFMALYQVWLSSGCTPSFTIRSLQILPLAKISSRTTYHNKMKYLVEQGYIRYTSSHYSKTGSEVFINDLWVASKKHGR